MPLTFILLALAICAIWLPSIPLGASFRVPVWPVLWLAAIVSGLVSGYLTAAAPLALGVLCAFAWLAQRQRDNRIHSIVFGWSAGLLALALALHLIPGFHNPLLIQNAHFTADAAPFTQYANFDKASVGLILAALLCKRIVNVSELARDMRQTIPVALITTIVVLGIGTVMGYVRPDAKWLPFTPIFLVTNLLFTCVAEESFFRGFLQDRLANGLAHTRYGVAIALICSSLLFGLAHVGGGLAITLLASLVGLGSGYAYYRTQRLEAAIATHFLVNAAHFIFFTYPKLQ